MIHCPHLWPSSYPTAAVTPLCPCCDLTTMNHYPDHPTYNPVLYTYTEWAVDKSALWLGQQSSWVFHGGAALLTWLRPDDPMPEALRRGWAVMKSVRKSAIIVARHQLINRLFGIGHFHLGHNLWQAYKNSAHTHCLDFVFEFRFIWHDLPDSA